MNDRQETEVRVDEALAKAIFSEAAAAAISNREINPHFDVMAEQAFEASAAYAAAVAQRGRDGMDAWLASLPHTE